VQINPYFRQTPSEILLMPYFNDLRIPELEKSAPQKLKLEIDQDNGFDYENGVSKQFQKKDYIGIIMKEYHFINKNRRAFLQNYVAKPKVA
jgi:hypothetical protein